MDNKTNRDNYICCGNFEKIKLQPKEQPDTQVSPISLPPSVNSVSIRQEGQKSSWCLIL